MANFDLSKIRNDIDGEVEGLEGKLSEIRKFLYDNPETGGCEEKGSAYLIQAIKEAGFQVSEPILDIPYSFRAVWESGIAGPTIGITQEYDALPGIGHGCGHNLIAAASYGAAVALKKAMEENALGGKVILYGTPAEENLVSKARMSAEGVFDELDIAMMVHPNSGEGGASGPTTALDAWQVDFYGKSSHAGAHPEGGINALDAAVHFYSLIGFEKQYLPGTNIYGVFADGGEKCNIIPDHAAVKYLVRAKTYREIRNIRGMFERCAQAAATAVGATYKIWNNEPGNMDVVTNETLSQVFNEAYRDFSGQVLKAEKTGGSTDMGDVSHVVPTIHPWPGVGCDGSIELHSAEFREATMGEGAMRMVKNSAKAMAMAGVRVLTEPELLKKIKEEFQQVKSDF